MSTLTRYSDVARPRPGAIQEHAEALLSLLKRQLRTAAESEMTLSAAPPRPRPSAFIVSAADVAEQVVARWRDAAQRKGIALKLVIETKGSVRADPLILARLLGKLIASMMDFTDCREVVITVASGDSRAAPARIVVTTIGTVVHPGHPSLRITRELALEMGCSFETYGDASRGSTFELTFPD